MQLAHSTASTERQRCPYCHDQLEVDALELIECPGCGTRHHRVCIAELGRCSVMGCERRLEARAEEGAPPAPKDSPIRRLVRQRYQERTRRFVQQHARSPDGLAARLDDALRRAREEEAGGRWRDAKETWAEVVRLLETASYEEREALEAKVPLREATRRETAAGIRSGEEWWLRLLTLTLGGLLLFAVFAMMTLAIGLLFI